MRRFSGMFLAVLLLFSWQANLVAEEGMWPLNEIHKLNLKAHGLKLELNEIYNPDGVSLIDGIVKVGGCTGSFVSPDGLILTNHHCAYRAAQAASTVNHDYITNGFFAHSRKEEIPAKGYTVRITESYQDVSAEVLSVVSPEMDLAERTRAIEKKIKEIVLQAEKKHPGLRAEVSEMFIGKTYVLFLYTYLRDIRLVYVPPRSIGNYGGEIDNWIWPRHTGDFSILRAYVAPDGSPADYSPDNVPYHPRKFLRIEPRGVDENDFVFILGYPGRTYRHRTSHFMAYEQEVRLPAIADYYAWQIDVMEEMSKKDRDTALKHLSRIKGLSNVMKNYRGKLAGLRRMNLLEKKREEERQLQQFIESDPKRKATYGTVLEEIGEIYREMRHYAPREMVLNYLLQSSILLQTAYTIYEASIERSKPDLERESAYMDRNFPRTKQRLFLTLADYYEPTDKVLLKERLEKAAALAPDLQIQALKEIVVSPEKIQNFIDNAYRSSTLSQLEIVEQLLQKSTQELKINPDPFIQLAIKLYPEYKKHKETQERRIGALGKLHSLLIDVKKEFLGQDFVPDANRTLRLTYGHIKGYHPRDAVYYSPITTLNGVIEKATGKEPFDPPQKLISLFKERNFGQYVHPKLKSVPVGILYNMDTTGGNSGSPVLNANGDLVGINFDRAWEATINDYAWSPDYSRSIGVDIRYVLWILDKFAGAEDLLREMGVK